MPNFTDKKSNFITEAIQTAATMLDAYDRMDNLRENNSDQEFLTSQATLELADEDFVGDNDHLDRALFRDALINGILPILTAIEANSNQIRSKLRTLLRT